MEDPNMIKNAVSGQDAMFSPDNLPPIDNGLPAIDQDQNNSITNIDRRLRVLEERFSNLHRRSQVSEQNVLKSQKDLTKEIKLSAAEARELKMQIHDIREKFRILVRNSRSLRNMSTYGSL